MKQFFFLFALLCLSTISFGQKGVVCHPSTIILSEPNLDAPSINKSGLLAGDTVNILSSQTTKDNIFGDRDYYKVTVITGENAEITGWVMKEVICFDQETYDRTLADMTNRVEDYKKVGKSLQGLSNRIPSLLFLLSMILFTFWFAIVRLFTKKLSILSLLERIAYATSSFYLYILFALVCILIYFWDSNNQNSELLGLILSCLWWIFPSYILYSAIAPDKAIYETFFGRVAGFSGSFSRIIGFSDGDRPKGKRVAKNGLIIAPVVYVFATLIMLSILDLPPLDFITIAIPHIVTGIITPLIATKTNVYKLFPFFRNIVGAYLVTYFIMIITLLFIDNLEYLEVVFGRILDDIERI